MQYSSYLHNTKIQLNNFNIFACPSLCLPGLTSGPAEAIIIGLTLKDSGGLEQHKGCFDTIKNLYQFKICF